MDYFTLETAYTISAGILLLSAFLSGFELARIPNLYIDFVSPKTNIERKHFKWLLMHTAQSVSAVLAVLLLLFSDYIFYQIVFVIIAGINLYSYKNRDIGKDGSDQLRLLALLAYSLCFLLNKTEGQLLSLYFSGAQVLLAYATSGTLKITSKYWRKGDVLAGILSTHSYGVPGISQFISKHPTLERVMSYSAIAAMLAVPLSFCFPYQEPLVITMSLMLGFHFTTSILMGLNDFLFTFPLAYPGILLLHNFVHQLA